MKPIKLVMQGFGPYAGREEVDFRDAIAARLFGIYGPTGSGKSSIFSAITFALFGQAAKSEQSIGTLRSDHAAPDCPTQVELLFELRDKLYYVRRRPDQERPKKNSGDGFTADQHAAWLFDATGLEIESIGPDNCGKPLAEKKVGAVGEEIQKLLGYGADQFRQIVLLPQGRFEAFLAAKSDERLTILRSLFDVSLYRRMTDKMVLDARESELAVTNGRTLCGIRLQQVGCESAEALNGAIRDAEVDAGRRSADLALAQGSLAAANEAYANAKTLADQFAAHVAAMEALATIEMESGKVAALKVRVEKARAVLGLADIDRELSEADTTLATAKIVTDKAKLANGVAGGQLGLAQVALQSEEARSAETAKFLAERGALERHSETLETVESLRNACAAKEHTRRETSETLDLINLDYQSLVAKQKADGEALNLANKNEAQRAKIGSRVEVAKSALEAARAYGDASRRADRAVVDLGKAKILAEDARAARNASKQVHQMATTALENARAQMLAETLIAGEACLVCGSRDHPSPATGEGNTAGLEEAVQTALADLERQLDAERAAITAVATTEGQAKELALGLSKLRAPSQSDVELSKETASLEAELAALGPEADVPNLEAALKSLAARIDTKAPELSLAQLNASAAETELAVALSSLDVGLRDVPEIYRDASVLNAERDRLTVAISERQGALETARSNEKAAAAAAQSAQKDFESSARDLAKAEAAYEKCSTRLVNRLADLGLNRETYDVHKADVDEIGNLSEEVAKHERALGQARGSVQQAKLALKDLEHPNLEHLAQVLTECVSAVQAAGIASANASSKLTLLDDLEKELAAEFARLDRMEEVTGPLRALAAAFKGENNLKTTLESFAIGAMFEQVVAAANLRLVPMSSGQYRFERDSETVSGRSKRGLDIRVHDVHTGRTRDISTLSGGESFIAALSLALGLSDVVEMSSGNIRLDTIFIDEGFGSLDTDNDSGTLDRVLQVLQDIVGQNRSVGLISHVPLVQQAIPNGFTIRKTSTGSSIEARTG